MALDAFTDMRYLLFCTTQAAARIDLTEGSGAVQSRIGEEGGVEMLETLQSRPPLAQAFGEGLMESPTCDPINEPLAPLPLCPTSQNHCIALSG